jgi:hypothetical protein
MDRKESWLLAETLAALRIGSFSERDVLALLMLLRPYAAVQSPIREFADFVAHRQRDRGILRTFVDRVQRALWDPQAAESQPIAFPLYTASALQKALNDVLAVLGTEGLGAELANQVVVCIISLLQSVKVDTSLKTSLAGFAVGISSRDVVLLGHGAVKAGHVFQFPLLVAANNGYEVSIHLAQFEVPLMTCNSIVEASSRAGRFQIDQRPTAA